MEDYFEAAYSVLANNDEDNSSEPEREEPAALAPEVGEFDLRGYELVRTQFLGTYREAFAIFNIDEVHFSSSCFKKIDEPDESERN